MTDDSQTINHLYQQNQRLGYRLNYLNDQNNFYRITINNIKKLNLNINKRLLTANQRILNTNSTSTKNSQHQNVVDPRLIGDVYTTITNKIHLKNVQMKVGNMKRRVDKYEKIHGGSLSSLVKQSQEIQKEINVLSRQFEFYTMQNQLLDNIYLDDCLISKLMADQWTMRKNQSQKNISVDGKSRNFRVRNSCKEKIELLQEQNLKITNKMQQIVKEQKQLRQNKADLLQKIKTLTQQKQKLSSQIYTKGFNIRVAQAQYVQRLRDLQKKQTQLHDEITRQDVLLEEQYKINQEFKQKIMDRNQLEVKDIKSLQDKIKKRAEEVRDIKVKCQNFQNGKSKTVIKLK